MKVKKLLLATLFVFVFGGRSFAQTIPNAGFEDWTDFPAYSDPTNWSSINSFLSGLGESCEKGTPGAVGASHLKLTVKDYGSGLLVGGFIQSHAPPFEFGETEPGFAMNARPEYLTGQYQHLTSAGDSSEIIIYLTKWNTSTSSRDLIGLGMLFITEGSVTSWTNFNVPILYASGNAPDSALILIGTGISNNPVLDDYLYIDDLGFGGTVQGIDELQDPLKMTIAPNPFSTQTLISFRDEQKNVTVRIMDAIGRQVKTFNFSGDHFTIEKEEMKAGVYFVQVIVENKNVMTKKITVQ